MEAVLQTPFSQVNQVLYKRKLNSYNVSFYSLGDKVGDNYLWCETQGQRGSCEVATCLVKFLQNMPSTTEEVSFFSDTCGGQNRNKHVTAAMQHFVSDNTNNIKVINQKFFESGHCFMECDSMHSAIETSKQFAKITHPDDWENVITLSRNRNRNRNRNPTVSVC